MPRDSGGRGKAHAFDAQAFDLLELPSRAAKTAVRGPRGSNDEYDWTLTGNATIDLVRDTGPMARGFVPYVVVGGGYLRQATRIGTRRFTSGEGTASAGAGVRLRLGQRAFIAPEIRVGYEPELRFGATLDPGASAPGMEDPSRPRLSHSTSQIRCSQRS